MIYPSLFKNKYPVLKGKDWIKHVEPDDLKVFVAIGMQHHDYGKARSATAQRDHRGRFAKSNPVLTEN